MLLPQGLEALVHLFLAGGADRGQRATVEGLVEGDQLVFVLVADVRVIGARGLDRAFHRLGAGIGEEHRVGKGDVDQPLRQPFTLRAAIEIGDMHQSFGLPLDGADQVRIGMTQRVHRDAGGEIEVARAVFSDQVAVLAAHGAEAAPGVDGHQRRDRHGNFLRNRNNSNG